MNNKKYGYIFSVLFVLLMTSGCASEKEPEASDTIHAKPSETNQGSATKEEDVKADSQKEVLIIIDQTPKPTEGNSFDFVVKQVPEGFTLAEMEWNSKKHRIVNTVLEAKAHGANGEDGFYISGNGQFSGFIYPDTMKGEQGEVVFLFTDSKGKVITWKKDVTLNSSATSQKESKKEVVTVNLQETLEVYMQAIASQDAEALVELYGGSYQGLRNLFPETDLNDKHALVKQYLKLGPKVSLKEILGRTEVSKDVNTFVVAFKNEDGTRFGVREFDKITNTFTYTVKMVNGKLKVMELPPYQA